MRLHPVMMTYLSKFGHFSLAFFSEVGDPQFFFIFGISNLWPNFRRSINVGRFSHERP